MGSPESFSPDSSRKATPHLPYEEWIKLSPEERKKEDELLSSDLSDGFRELREGKGNTNSQGDVRH